MEQLTFSFPDRKKGYTCTCCGSFVKTYIRRFNSNMSIALLVMYKNRSSGFIKVEDYLLSVQSKRCGDFSYLRHYGLIEKKQGLREDGSSRNGYYRITMKGAMFAENNYKVNEKFIIANNKCEGFTGKMVTIKDTLGTKFNYDELMGN